MFPKEKGSCAGNREVDQEIPTPVINLRLSGEKLVTLVKKLGHGIYGVLAAMFSLCFKVCSYFRLQRRNDDPLEQTFTLKDILSSVLAISPRQHGFLLTLFGYFLAYFIKSSTALFLSQFAKTLHSTKSSYEVTSDFSPEIAHITGFLICYAMSWILVLLLDLGVQFFLVPVLISVPLLYFPDLLHKASALGIQVAWGPFNLSLITFVTSAAFGVTLAFGLVTLLVLYVNGRFSRGRTPTRGQDIEIILNGDDLNANNIV